MLLVGKDVKYAASGNTANAALTPDLLDAGSIGIYTVGSDGKLKLITIASSGTGKILASDVKPTDIITMYQGLGNGSQFISESHDVRGIRRVFGSIYRAATPQTAYIGYNPVTGAGDLNVTLLPTTGNTGNGLVYTNPDLLYRQEASINYRLRLAGNNEFGNHKYITTPVVPTDTPLSIATKLVAEANAPRSGQAADFVAKVVGNNLAAPVQTASATAASGGTIAAGTYYAKVVALNADGQSLGSNEISQVTTGSTSTITWNWVAVAGATSYRVYVGISAGNQTAYTAVGNVVTLIQTAPAPTAGTVSTSTAIGISLTDITYTNVSTTLWNDKSPFPLYSLNVFGVIDNASVTQGGVIDGSGYPYQIRKLEKESMPYRGDLYTLSVLDKHLPSQVDFAATYDLYEVRSINTTDDKTGSEALTTSKVVTWVAFVVQGDVVGTNQQADWEDIMTVLFPTASQISA